MQSREYSQHPKFHPRTIGLNCPKCIHIIRVDSTISCPLYTMPTQRVDYSPLTGMRRGWSGTRCGGWPPDDGVAQNNEMISITTLPGRTISSDKWWYICECHYCECYITVSCTLQISISSTMQISDVSKCTKPKGSPPPDVQGSFWVWAQPMRGDITMQRPLSLAEPMLRIVPDALGTGWYKYVPRHGGHQQSFCLKPLLQSVIV